MIECRVRSIVGRSILRVLIAMNKYYIQITPFRGSKIFVSLLDLLI